MLVSFKFFLTSQKPANFNRGVLTFYVHCFCLLLFGCCNKAFKFVYLFLLLARGSWALGHALWLISAASPSTASFHCRAQPIQLPLPIPRSLSGSVHRLGDREYMRRGQYGPSQCGHHSGLSAEEQVSNENSNIVFTVFTCTYKYHKPIHNINQISTRLGLFGDEIIQMVMLTA